MRDLKIVDLSGTPREVELSRHLQERLGSDLARINPQSTNSNIVFACEDRSGNLTGGICGSTSYGWLLIKILWVSPSVQGSGIGRSLLEKAMFKAASIGCHSAWLDTSNADARDFYMHLEFEVFGELANQPNQHPTGHKRWFMSRAISTS